MVPPDVIEDRRLSATAFRVYVGILSFTNGAGEAWPTNATLAARCGMSTNSMRAALGTLKTNDLLSVRYRDNGTRVLVPARGAPDPSPPRAETVTPRQPARHPAPDPSPELSQGTKEEPSVPTATPSPPPFIKKALTPQQQRVKSLFEVFAETGWPPPEDSDLRKKFFARVAGLIGAFAPDKEYDAATEYLVWCVRHVAASYPSDIADSFGALRYMQGAARMDEVRQRYEDRPKGPNGSITPAEYLARVKACPKCQKLPGGEGCMDCQPYYYRVQR